jgi:hypothetical protein
MKLLDLLAEFVFLVTLSELTIKCVTFGWFVRIFENR